MRRAITALIGLVASAGLAVPGIASAAPTESTSPAHDPSQAVTSPTQTVRVVVTLDNQPATASSGTEAANLAQQDALLDTWSEAFGLTVDRQFGYLVNGFSAEIPEDKIPALAAAPGVATVQRSREYVPTDEHSSELVQATAAGRSYGVDGSGLVVAIIDTGIDASHQDMRLDADAQGDVAITDYDASKGFTLKVPYGHNFADENDTVKDTTSSQHGMHVAGIVAANGGSEDASPTTTGTVNGIAPNAQLLAMKVFSNAPAKSGSAYDDDIIAAIEDSVKHGADVINMSLGSVGGFTDSDYGIQRAVDTATEAGTFVVVSAGNSGLRGSSSGETEDYYGYQDSATVGGPSTALSALSVASVENSVVTSEKASAYWSGTDTADLSFPYSHQAGDLVTAPTEIVDAGLGGAVSDFAGAKGKIALVQRGDYSFADKIANAFEAGADGILVYNNDEGGDEIVSMAGTEGATGFVGFAGYSYGSQIAAQLQAGHTVRVTLTADAIETGNAAALTPSGFTSWGPAPDLEFKPDIAGIGGNVYSTLNDNTYGSMSGTSMASPQLAGIVALGLQEYQERFADANDVDLNALFRTALINTAHVLEDADGVPYAPRQIGAGLAQTEDALDTSVFATVDGDAHVALKEVDAPRTVTVTLTNKGDADLTFTPDATAVTEAHDPATGVVETRDATDSVAASSGSVTVPAHGTATASFAIAPDTSADDHYLEGWLDFDSASDTQPDLRVPFLGYVGDWNAEDVIDPYAFSEEAVYPALFGDGEGTKDPSVGTQLATVSDGATYYLGDGGWISPNGDGQSDEVLPLLTLMRNAQRIDYSVLDSSGAVIARPGTSSEVSAPALADVLAGKVSQFHVATEAMFGGTVWNAKTAEDGTLPDGRYTFQATATIADGFAAQDPVSMPFGIDTVAPTVSLQGKKIEDDRAVLTYSFSDTSGAADGGAAGWSSATVLADQAEVEGAVSGGIQAGAASGTFTVTVPEGTASIQVTAVDQAGNPSRADVQTVASGLAAVDRSVLAGGPINDATRGADGRALVEGGQLSLRVRAGGQIASAAVDGGTPVDVDASTGLATLTAPITEGTTSYTLQGFDAAGAAAGGALTVSVTYDVTAPEVTIGSATANADGTVTVAGSVTDNIATAPSVIVNGKASAVEPDGSFSVTLDAVARTRRTVTVTASDGVNLAPAQAARIEAPAAEGGFVLDSNVDPANEIVHAVTSGDPDLAYAQDGSAQFHVTGQLAAQPQEFSIGGAGVTVAADGTFDAVVPLAVGVNDTNFRLVDADGTLVWDYAVKFLYDEEAPAVTVDSVKPGEIVEDPDATDPARALSIRVPADASSAGIALAGTISDETASYTLTVNNDTVANFETALSDFGNAAGTWKWSGTVHDDDTIRLVATDQLGNARTLYIGGVILDTTSPDVAVNGVVDGDVITAGAETPVAVSTSDPEATVSAELNGEPLEAATEDGTSEVAFDAGALEPGTYVLTARATDWAGNESEKAVTFLVNAVPVIDGPDSLVLNPDTDLPFDPAAHWSVTDDQDGTELVADPEMLALGDNTVVLTATDSHGAAATRTVTVTLARPVTTLASGCVSMDAAFAAGDSLSATCSTSGNQQTVAVSNARGTLTGVLTIASGLDVQRVEQVVDGQRLPVSFEKVDGGVRFTGPSDATFVLVGRATADTLGAGSDGSGAAVPIGGAGGGSRLSSTGAWVRPLLLAAGALALGGLGLAGWRRRSAHMARR
jgi:lactocepin